MYVTFDNIKKKKKKSVPDHSMCVLSDVTTGHPESAAKIYIF